MKNYEQFPFRGEDIPLVRLKVINPRKTDERTIAKIRSSIEQIGLLEPLHVCLLKDGDYGILDGNRRMDVLLELGVETAPCFVFDVMDIYTANHQVNHLTPVEEARMLKKALEYVDEQEIAKVFGLKRIKCRLHESLLKRLHPTVIKAFNSGKITKACAQELSNVTPGRQLEIFAKMQNTKNFSPNFVKAQILQTPVTNRQSIKTKTPWVENKERENSVKVSIKEMQDDHSHLTDLYREYTAALMLTVIHVREILSNQTLANYLETNLSKYYMEIKEIIDSELIEKKDK